MLLQRTVDLRWALVVDDEPLVRQFIAAVVSRLGWRTLEASDGQSALMLARNSKIDLLITDYEMEGLDGIALADQCRDLLPDLPIIVISGNDKVASLARSRDYRFIGKPFDVREFSSLIGPRPGSRPTASGMSVGTRDTPRAATAAPGVRRRSGIGVSRPATDEPSGPVGTATCTLQCYPPGDVQFAALATRILAESGSLKTWPAVLAQLRDRLVETYPAAVVHPRSRLAANGDPNEYWYCYRDGALIPDEPDT